MRTCPGCGESCAQAWCGFCEKVLPGTSCALGQCADPTCYICTVMPEKFRVERCVGEVGDKPCRLVARHRGPCVPSTRKRETFAKDGDKRDGAPALAGFRRKKEG